ncbi:MAG: PQQ-binding-like beta-propeller repeat protein, partial [Planctomycetota bacterium]
KAAAVVAVDGQSGEKLWERPEEGISGGSLAAEDGRVCYRTGGRLVAADLETGEKLWSTSSGGGGGYVVMHGDVVLVTGGGTTAYAASSGEKLWSAGLKARSMPGIFVADGLVWSSWPSGTPYPGLDASVKGNRTILWDPRKSVRKGHDPRSGKVKKKVVINRLVTPGHHIRCYPPKATERYLLLNKRGVEFLDLEGEDHMRHDWLRAPCYYGFMPANGLTYMPPHQCFCYPGVLMSGFNALTSRRGPDIGSSGVEDRLARGPAAGEVPGPQQEESSGKDWPTYRHDPLRSGSVEWSVPAKPGRMWQVEAGGKLSPPVAADGKLFVADINAHAVRCLDAEDGEELWTYAAGARVDSPPTVHEGRVLFGSADGNVYCLRASDGSLVWRFRAAPARQWISVRGQLESAWPSHGSVLVRDGLVYVTAGRSSHLEGGIRLYALEPETGDVVHRRTLQTPRPDVSREAGRPFDMEGSRSDILVSGPEHIYLYQERFDLDLSPDPMRRVTKLGDREGGPHLMATGGFLSRQWSNGAFNRVYWMYSSRWPGYYFGYEAPRTGQIIVFDEETTYAVKYYAERHGHSPEFRPGSGYRLVADRNSNDPVLRTARWGQEKGGGFSREQFWKWSRQVPVRVEAMVQAGDRLYLAGPPDLEGGTKARDAIRGLQGARFRVVSAADGRKISSRELEEAPVFDGLIAAYGRLYMATQQGTLICLGADGTE